MADVDSVIQFPASERSHVAALYSLRNKECVCCRTLKMHSVENFRGCVEIRNGKPHVYIKRICRVCEHVKRTEHAQRKRAAGQKAFSPNRFVNYRKGNLKRYGLTLDAYDALLQTQGGKCAICRTDHNGVHQSGRPKSLAVDHCHKTGRVRGLLCSSCNHGIGELKDDPHLLALAIVYLERGA